MASPAMYDRACNPETYGTVQTAFEEPYPPLNWLVMVLE